MRGEARPGRLRKGGKRVPGGAVQPPSTKVDRGAKGGVGPDSPADAVSRFEDGHLVAGVDERSRRREARHSGTDNDDPFGGGICTRWNSTRRGCTDHRGEERGTASARHPGQRCGCGRVVSDHGGIMPRAYSAGERGR